MKIVWLLAGIIGLAGIALAVFFFRSLSKPKTSQNVVHISQYKKKTARGAQKCTYCKKRVDSLTFYSGHEGKVIGLCRDCSRLAKHQDLMPI
ncbi:Uncharacterised protein [Chlamydia abortus]|uniref:HNH endonuclease n=1 Tax=Paenibacillus residui TaxID=629724 RepID=A0ABW3DAY9_9BACL|nr:MULTISPECIES: hypothetical protein [Paenibacillaceae]SHE11871.1 Uncharacterised protein [Chlamydia abortus]